MGPERVGVLTMKPTLSPRRGTHLFKGDCLVCGPTSREGSLCLPRTVSLQI